MCVLPRWRQVAALLCSLSSTTFETFFSLLLLDDSNSKSIPNLVFTKAEFCSFF